MVCKNNDSKYYICIDIDSIFNNVIINFNKMISKYLKGSALILLVLFMASCLPDEDLNPDAGDIREEFVGTWRFTETPIGRAVDAVSYTVTISYDQSNSSQVLLKNFAQVGGQFSAYGIVTNNRITIPSQEVAQGFTVSGTGTMSESTSMDWEYTTIAGSTMESFTAVATK